MAGDVGLREVRQADLPIFYEQQLDEQATAMAAFPARDRDAFMRHWRTILGDPDVVTRTVVAGDEVAGNIVSFQQSGEREVGYWLGREFWGRGVATAALRAFLLVETRRPLTAHVARHNIASRRVLERCGFILRGEALASGFPGGLPGQVPDVEELILRLA